MKRELLKALGRNYKMDGNNILDTQVQGFDPKRNVATVREVRGVLYVNRYRGYHYKPHEEVQFDSVEEAKNYILEGRGG